MPSQSDRDFDKFVVDKAGNDAADGRVKLTGYGLGGEEVPADDPACLAKLSHDPATGRSRHWLKRATNGPESGHLYNPHSPLFEPGGVNRVVAHLGVGQYEFRPATEAAFDAYLRFLETDNTLHLRQAERE